MRNDRTFLNDSLCQLVHVVGGKPKVAEPRADVVGLAAVVVRQLECKVGALVSVSKKRVCVLLLRRSTVARGAFQRTAPKDLIMARCGLLAQALAQSERSI